ncbi:MAG: AAA family ATPase [Oscillospiraceae bacterium]|nr:AAA family ATPase [Candidatus Limimonas egerieequi]
MATKTIAVAGKGGVGKTTTCGMLIDYLTKKSQAPLLVVDADANSNLNEVLGVEAEVTLGSIREEIAHSEIDGKIPDGMSKADYAEFKFEDALIEEKDFDMIVMGRTQGQGCYCFVNGLLKSQIDKYIKNYSYTVIDNEAGLEHISRGTLPHVDVMFLVSDCSRRGIQAVARIRDMIDELKLNPGEIYLIVNRAPNGELSDGVKEEIEKHNLPLLGVLPHDDLVYEYDCDGKPTAYVPDTTPVKAKLFELMKKIDI